MRGARTISVLLYVAVFIFTAATVSANPLTWTVTGAFNDGASVSGSFTFDADTGSVTNWNIVTTAGSTLPGFTYTAATSFANFQATDGVVCTANCFIFSKNNNQLYLLLEFTSPLTDNGGAVNFSLGQGSPNASLECDNCSPFRVFTSGSATALLGQTITFDAIPNQSLGVSPFPLAAQSSAFLPITFSSTTPNVCTTAGSLVQLLSNGTCSINANQAGNAVFQAASATRSFNVGQANISGTLLSAASSPFQAGASPYMVAVADFNGDGKLDLAIADNGASQVTLLLGDGNGGFAPAANSPFSAGNGPYFIASGDFNADGIPDLAIPNEAGNNLTLLLGQASGSLAAAPNNPFPTGLNPSSVAIGDFNGDGIQDFAVTDDGQGGISILLGNPNFRLAASPVIPTGVNPLAIAVGDFNGDGIQDLAVANYNGGSVSILLGTGTGQFSAGNPIPGLTNPSSVAVGDFNRDGIQDIVIADLGANAVRVFLGNGRAGFTEAPGSPFRTGAGPRGLVVGDFNGDGIQDIATANSSGSNLTLLLGNGSGGFTEAGGSPFSTGTVPLGLAAADFNGDGIEDIAVANSGDGTVTVLLGSLSATTSTLSTTSPLSIFVGASVPLTLTVSNPGTAYTPPTGSATFFDGVNNLGTANQNGSPYSFTVSSPAAGSHTFQANYGGGSGSSASASNSITVNVVLQPQTITFSLPGSVTLGAGSVTISATATSNLPVSFTSNTPGVCTVNGTTVGIASAGTCSITASQAGNAAFAAAAPVTRTFIVYPRLTISLSTSSIATPVGGSVAVTASASGGTQSYTYSASGLPSGITFSGASLGGAPAQAGTYTVTISVSDSAGNSASSSVTINALGVTTTSLSTGTAGQFYAVTLSASGGTAGYTFTATGVPTGLSLTDAGYLSGTPATAGTSSVVITVSSGGVSSSATLSLVIAKPAPLTISSAALASGTVNVQYSASFGATGGFQPYAWAISSGAPPAGLTMHSSGVLSGTPTTPGSGSFGVIVTDAAGSTATATATITIQPAPLVISTQALPDGMIGVPYPQQQLAVTGGVPPLVWSVSGGGSLPQGLTLSSDGVLTGTPEGSTPAASSLRKMPIAHATSGGGTAYSVGLTVADQAGTKGTLTLGLNVRAPAADLILSAGSLSFAISSPATGPPAPQAVGVQSTVASQQITYSVAVNPSVSWLSITSGTTTPSSIQVSLTPDALTLAPGAYQTTLIASCTSSTCSGHTQSVTVALNVTALPPRLQVANSLISFATPNTASGALSQPINLINTGGGTLGFASVICEAAWCNAGPVPASVSGGVSTTIPITVNPVGLKPGFYRTQVDLVTSGGNGSVAVTLFIAPAATMALAPQGAQLNMLAGGAPGNPNGSFLVAVNGANVNWSAAIVSIPGVPSPDWLVLGTPSGNSTPDQPGTVSFSVSPTSAAALAPGAYYAAIEVSSPDVSNSPLDFEVVLNVAPANSPTAPDPEPAGLLFVTNAGGVVPPETVTVYSASASASTFQASASTVNGQSWLSVTPTIGTASTSSPAVTTVSVDASKLSPGVYAGGVSYSLSATAVRTVNVTLIVTGSAQSAASGEPARAAPKAAGCTPSQLVPAQTGLVNNFLQPAAWPTPLQIVLSNDCGTPVSTAQIVATFSNADPPLVLPLVNSQQGLYSGTWAPAHANSQVSVKITANAPGFAAATSQITGAVAPNAVPVITSNGAVHGFDPLVGGALAPGTIVAIYGQNLADKSASVTNVPLPTTFNGTTVLIGGLEAPLYFVSPGQVNAQIPFELLPGSQYDVLISANGALTNPQPIQLSPATPGLAAFADGTLIAQHNADGSLVTSASPARPGEYLVSYLAGLGDTNVTVASGAASPSSPLAQPSVALSLTINGAQYPTAFVGLTPGLVGLYQMDFQVPAGLSAGNLTLTVSQNGLASNQTLLPYKP